jgi:hypothetical protein
MHVFCGIDWSHTHHDACFLDARGQVLSRLTLAHTADGLSQLDRARGQLGVTRAECQVGLESAHTLLIDFCGIKAMDMCSSVQPARLKVRGGASASRPRCCRQPTLGFSDLPTRQVHHCGCVSGGSSVLSAAPTGG